ncbi:MAG: glutamate-cysteine ligase family protein, partial [Aggregatilineales bacterium]
MFRPPLTLGVEEEYMIVDAQTRALSPAVRDVLARSRQSLGDQVKAEFMQSQIEIATGVCHHVSEVREQLIALRRGVNAAAEAFGKRIVAAATHPFSQVHEQPISEGERYSELASDMQYVARRLVIFGMHIHIGFGEGDEARALLIDVMNQLRYFLPQ